MKKCIFTALFILFSIKTFSQINFIKTNYQLDTNSFKIAVVPLFSIDKKYSQILIDLLIIDSVRKIEPANLDSLVHNIFTDSLLNKSINTILTKEYVRKELKNNPNLSMFMDQLTIDYTKLKLDKADMLLIPSNISSKTVLHLNGTGNTTVHGRFRLYDLNNGSLIFDLTVNKNVDFPIEQHNTEKVMQIILDEFLPFYYKYFSPIIENKI